MTTFFNHNQFLSKKLRSGFHMVKYKNFQKIRQFVLAFILKIPFSSNYSSCWLKCTKKLRRLKNEKHEILLFMKFQIIELFLSDQRIMRRTSLSSRQSAIVQQLITENSIDFKKKFAVLLLVKFFFLVLLILAIVPIFTANNLWPFIFAMFSFVVNFTHFEYLRI